MITCIIASASAASVPGRIGMCQSDFSAVRWRTGSMQTTLAPLRCASSMNGQRCRLFDSTLQAQIAMYREWTSDSGSTAAVGPSVMR